LIKHPLFFSNGYELTNNHMVGLPNFVLLIIVASFGSLYIARTC